MSSVPGSAVMLFRGMFGKVDLNGADTILSHFGLT